MNPVIEELLQIIEKDPLPDAHTSSHWKLFGRETIVARHGDELILKGYGFESTQGSALAGMAKAFERLSYREVTARIDSYNSVWRTARGLARDLSFDLTFYVWRQAVALAVLVDHWSTYNLAPRTFALIGDGHGFLGALIHRWLPESRVYCIDLPKILIFQARTHELAKGAGRMATITRSSGVGEANTIFVPAQNIEAVSDDIDCAINMASMQEMNDFSISAYFTFLRRRSTPQSRFYCVNRLSKELPQGEIATFNDYPWSKDDEVFFDGSCPYYTHFIGPSTLSRGPRLLGVRVPFINYFDGIMMHRLVHLAHP